MRILCATLSAGIVLVTGAIVSYGDTSMGSSLLPVSAFDKIADKNERAVAIFIEAGKVIQSPRCMNCHPAGDRPAQGDDRHPHEPLVSRGPDNFGALAMRCTTCHGPANFDAGGVPGNPKWHMAPIEMAWVGKSLGEICEQIKDQKRNGGRTLEEIVNHMSDDDLVGWAWNPGRGRTPAPGTQKVFGELIRTWIDLGGACPAL